MRKKSGEEKQLMGSGFGLSRSQPLVCFALCRGATSDPMLKVYRSTDIKEQLEAAKKDYLQTNVLVKKSRKVLLPRLLESFSKEELKKQENQKVPAISKYYKCYDISKKEQQYCRDIATEKRAADRHLQLRIEAQGKYLQSVLEKAQETLGKNLGSAGLEAAKVQLSELDSKVSTECLSSSSTAIIALASTLVKQLM
ncbi:hypothetical protein ACLOJK_012890 [Asimina triloba]